MKERKALIEDFYHMHKGFGFLQSMHLYRDEEDIHLCCLDIILGNHQLPEKKMLLHFSGVVDFKSANLNSLYNLLICIIDVSENQMEEINYRVKEDEYELFSFCCSTFQFEESTNERHKGTGSLGDTRGQVPCVNKIFLLSQS